MVERKWKDIVVYGRTKEEDEGVGVLNLLNFMCWFSRGIYEWLEWSKWGINRYKRGVRCRGVRNIEEMCKSKVKRYVCMWKGVWGRWKDMTTLGKWKTLSI